MPKGTFPDIIKMLPRVDIGVEGVKGWRVQGKRFQLAFFEAAPNVSIAPHSHAAQYGILFEGEATLTLNGKKTRTKQGDSYYIPERAVHSWEIHTFVRSMDFYADLKRYHIADDESKLQG